MGCCKRWVVTRYKQRVVAKDGLLQDVWVVAGDGLLQDRWVVAEDWLLQGTACRA